MEKTHGINYRTRKRLITTSIVIKSLVAFLLLFVFFYLIANIDILRLYYAIIIKYIDPTAEVTIQSVNEAFILICILVPLAVIFIFANIAYNVFWGIKSKKVFYRSEKQIVVFQFVNCLSFIFMPISGIFMLIASYTQDDGFPPKISRRKQNKLKQNANDKKPQKTKLSKVAKVEIKKLKYQKRKGIISQEKFDKLVSKIKKEDMRNCDKK